MTTCENANPQFAEGADDETLSSPSDELRGRVRDLIERVGMERAEKLLGMRYRPLKALVEGRRVHPGTMALAVVALERLDVAIPRSEVTKGTSR